MVSGAGLTVRAVEEVVLRLKELLFPTNADIAVRSVGVDIEKSARRRTVHDGWRRLPGMRSLLDRGSQLLPAVSR